MSDKPRNIAGQRLNKNGTVDKRHFGKGRPAQTPALLYDILHVPSNKKLPYQVHSYDADTGERLIVSKHSKELAAWKRAEQLRMAQPDRRPSAKYKHKLAVTTRRL